MSIVRLSDEVVNRIAAGEVVVRPVNAVKELIENSIDAGANEISIVFANGGLTKVSVSDNGHGIQEEDMPLVCERFATSKLKHADDLVNIMSLGFRGEALSSISQVAHVSVASRSGHSDTGVQANYFAGKMVEEKREIAMQIGTKICFQDLFFNQPVRKRGLGSASEEYKRVVDLVQRFATLHPEIAFELKKNDTAMPDLITLGKNADMADVVTRFFGINKDKDLVRLVTSTVVSGLISRVEMAGGSSWFLLAINGRLVESASIKKVVEQELAAMGRKMGLAILILNLDPTTVDVNVHPTKKEVIFAETEFVLMEVRDAIKNSANVASTVRITTLSQPMKNPLIMTSSQPPEVLSSSQQPVVSQSKKIRTDSRQMGLSQLGKVALKGRNNWVWVGDMSGDWGLVQRGEELLAANVRALALKYLDRDQRKVDEIRQVPVFLDSLEKRDWERLGISIINDGEDELEWFVGLVSLLTLWNAVSDDICEEDEGDNLVVPLAKLSQLYREFERC